MLSRKRLVGIERMADSLEATYRPLLEAISFAARAHKSQLRKDRETPYVSHVFRVCLIARHVLGVEELHVLQAAALHDTVEDTTTDYDDVQEDFGAEVAGWVATLSKDKRLEEHDREEAYKERLSKAPWQVRVCKLADIFDNLMDSQHTQPEQRARTLKRSADYLEALRVNLPEQARWPWEIVAQLLAEMKAGSA